jgi:DNA-binding NarL/FixJ family response regulator
MAVRILFVDDDPHVLDGYRKVVRKHRERWDIVFALGGPAARDEVQRAVFDVVMTDMRMPELDGAALLALVRERDPSTIRMILSGYSEHRGVLRAPPIAHHSLDKPCDSKEVIAVLERGCALRRIFVREPLRALVDRFAKLPTRLVEAAIGRVIEQDSTLSDGILRFASSACFAFDQPVTSIPDAISRIGLDVVAAFAFATGASPSEAFMTRLVRDIGKIAIAVAMPEQDAAILRRIDERAMTRSAIEREILGTTHAEVGAYLLAQWGLPLSTIEAVAFYVDVIGSGKLMSAPIRIIAA